MHSNIYSQQEDWELLKTGAISEISKSTIRRTFDADIKLNELLTTYIELISALVIVDVHATLFAAIAILISRG